MAPTASPSIAHVAEQAGLAHDAGNLLGALGLYCGLLSSPGVLRPEHRHYATELNLISARSSALIQRLLKHHPEFLAEPVANPATDPAEALRRLGPVLQRIAAGTHLTVIAPATLPQLDLPAETLERITVNLVRNAAEAMRNQSPATNADASAGTHYVRRSGDPARIAVNLAVIAGRATLTVEDNGPGIPPAIAAAFLRPTPLPPGAVRGLGHRIIHELATASGGQLSIRVRPGRGTVFCIKWPLRETHPVAGNGLHAPQTASAPQEGQMSC
jgi:nitrogen-specific signal transduction histidine kinase